MPDICQWKNEAKLETTLDSRRAGWWRLEPEDYEAPIDECEEEAQRELSFTDYLAEGVETILRGLPKATGGFGAQAGSNEIFIPTDEILNHTTRTEL